MAEEKVTLEHAHAIIEAARKLKHRAAATMAARHARARVEKRV